MIKSKANMPVIEKFYHLKSHVTGGAHRLIEHYRMTEENFGATWKSLKGRCDNHRVLVKAKLITIIDQPSMSSS